MDTQFNPKNTLLSIVYVIMLTVLLLLINAGFSWLFNNVLSDMFNWFNERSLLLKIILLVIGATIIVKLVLSLLTVIAASLNIFVLSKFPTNTFTEWASILLVWASAIYTTIVLWKLPDGYDFWIVIELLFLTYFIFGINFIFIKKPITQ